MFKYNYRALTTRFKGSIVNRVTLQNFANYVQKFFLFLADNTGDIMSKTHSS